MKDGVRRRQLHPNRGRIGRQDERALEAGHATGRNLLSTGKLGGKTPGFGIVRCRGADPLRHRFGFVETL
jgi:hypothetical protein